MENIRNISIIAHVDHGKSTLADRILERTGAISEREMKNQLLDQMELERERGITIKMQPVSFSHTHKGTEYLFNLIDTPGHIDFSYEVSRSLRAVEGVLLLVDATQGVQAQTMSVLAMAKEARLVVIPVLSKIDMPNAQIDKVKKEIATLLNCQPIDVLETSGKTGSGVEELLGAIIEKVPHPKSSGDTPKALVFDFSFSSHTGVVAYTRVFSGSFSASDSCVFLGADKTFQAKEVGVFVPSTKKTASLQQGRIGYITTGIKEPGIPVVGDTVAKVGSRVGAFSGYSEPVPVIWASLYPQEGNDFATLVRVLKELKLSDGALSFEEERSSILGKGFRCGFLGMLHLEIITERIRREFGLELIITSPSTDYVVHTKKGEVLQVSTPASFPDHGDIASVEEPWVRANIITPSGYISRISQLLIEHEGAVMSVEDFQGERSIVHAELPLRELMRRFFDRLKSITSGYASLSYTRIPNRPAQVSRLDIYLAEEFFPAFSSVVSKAKGESEGRKLVEAINELLPRAQFVIKIQAKFDGRIVASKTLSALRKNVTAKLYGGDITRKMKLREKQKKGKAKMNEGANVRVSHDVFLKVIQRKDT